MPKHKCKANIPEALKGVWYVESPEGKKVFEEEYEGAGTYEAEVESTSYSAHMFVDAGVRAAVAEGKVYVKQELYLTVTPQRMVSLSLPVIEKPKVLVTTENPFIGLSNKFRTVVTVSVSG
jgi:hypothetical protein